MRIAHIVSTPEGLGGAEKILLQLVEESAVRGYDYLVINPFDLTPSDSQLARGLGPRYRSRSTTRFSQLVSTRRWLRQQLDDFGADVVHAHLFHALVLTGTLPKSSVGPSVMTHHHGNHLVMQGRWFMERCDRWGGRRFDRVVACSDWVKRFLIEDYSYPSDRVVCIRNGWAGEPILRDELGTQSTIVCVANFRAQKDHATLLRAFKKVLASKPDTRLRLLGEGPLREPLERMVTELRISHAVTFEGEVPVVWPYLAASSVFVLSSTYEPLGIAVLEAMAAGLPVVASNVGGIPELVDHEGTGLLVSPEDSDSFATAILHLLNNPKRAVQMGEAGRVAAEEFRIEKMLSAYFHLYEELMGDH